jgi:AraC-like DNA-binding protein
MSTNKHHLSLVEYSQFSTFLEALEMTHWDIYAMLDKALFPKSFNLYEGDGVILTERVYSVFNLLDEQLTEPKLIQYLSIVAKKNAGKILQALPFQDFYNIEELVICFINETFRSSPNSQFSLMETLGSKWLVRHKLPQNDNLSVIECYLLKLFHELIYSAAQIKWLPNRIFLQSPHAQEKTHQRCMLLFNNKDLQLISERDVTGIELPEYILKSKINVYRPLYEFSKSDADLGKNMRTISEALRYVLPHYLSGGRPSLDFSAEICGLHSRTLKRRLRKEGVTYTALLDEIIISLAKDALLSSDQNITDISINLGYEHPNHFSRMFKRLTGLSPKHYRNLN